MTKNLRVIIVSVTLLLLGSLTTLAQAQSYRELAAAPLDDVFAIDSDGSIDHRYQREPSGAFAGLEDLGNTATDIAALELADGGHEVFIVDRDQSLWHTRQAADADAWTPWEQLDNATKQVSVARSASGRVELFVIGSDDALWHMGRLGDDAAFGSWQRLDVPDVKATQLSAAAADGDGFVVAMIGADRSLWLLSFSDAGELASQPTNLDGESFDVALARFPGGGHSLLTVGNNNELWERRRAAGQDFGDWQNLGRSAQRVALSSAQTGQAGQGGQGGQGGQAGIELFTLGADGSLASAQLSAADAAWGESQTVVQAGPLASELKGRARLIIPSLDVDKDVDVTISLRFSVDRTAADIMSFPSVVTDPFDTPFGTTTSTVSLARSSTGELRRDEGSLSLPVTLHFDQSLDLPIIQEDGDLSVDLSTEAEGGQRLDAASGRIILSGRGRFAGQGSTNPIDGQDAQIIVTGKLTPLP